MAKLYLIGGTPRTGKTSLQKLFLQKNPILAASTDAIRYAIQQLISPEHEPDLFRSKMHEAKQPFYGKNDVLPAQEKLDLQNKQSRIVWRSVLDFSTENLAEGVDSLVEGVAVLPELVSQLSCEYKVVFIGNCSSKHKEVISRIAKLNSDDWMHSFDDEALAKYADAFMLHSQFIRNEAAKYKLPYVEMNDDNFAESLQNALKVITRSD